MSGTKVIKYDKKINYNFLLKCMIGLTAAAVVTAGAIAIATTAYATPTAVGFAAATTAAFAAPIAIAAIIGIAALVTAAYILPFFFLGNRATIRATVNSYDNHPFWWGLLAPIYSTMPIYRHNSTISNQQMHTHNSINNRTIHSHETAPHPQGGTHSHRGTHPQDTTIHTHHLVR